MVDDPNTGFTASLAKFIVETAADDVPKTGRAAVVRAITDGIGVTLAGLDHESTEITGAFTKTLPRESLPIGGGSSADLAERALHLGTAAHALDYDDLTWAMDGHPTVVLLPPILALADRVDPSGKDVIAAYAAGFETASHVAAPISPEHYEAGWHATSTFGTIGATATAASLLDLDVTTTETALNIAASMPSGVKENFGTMTKPLHAGLAARSGVTAALLAADGFTAGRNAIDGSKGFLSLYSGDGDPGEISAAKPTSDGWSLVDPGIHLKRYPACYFTHSSIAATRSLLESNDLDPADVTAVRVSASRGAGDALKYTEPKTSLESKFSMPHAVSVALVADTVGVDWFEPAALDDEALAQHRSMVEFVVDDEIPYDSHTATVTLDTTAGTFTMTNDTPPWTHQDPPSREELEAKFLEAATHTVDRADAEAVFARLQDLETTELADALAPITN